MFRFNALFLLGAAACLTSSPALASDFDGQLVAVGSYFSFGYGGGYRSHGYGNYGQPRARGYGNRNHRSRGYDRGYQQGYRDGRHQQQYLPRHYDRGNRYRGRQHRRGYLGTPNHYRGQQFGGQRGNWTNQHHRYRY